MEQFEKVCKGLEELRNFADTKVHPIVSPENWGVYSDLCDLIDEFGTDALALIRQQRERIKELEAARAARVMTLEELEDALDTVVWVEEPEFENFADHYALIMAYSHKVGFVRVSFGFAEMPVDCEYEYEDYGKKWRCWTQRPTDEQRKAVKWDEPPKEG